MSIAQLIERMQHLPEDAKKEVEDFIAAKEQEANSNKQKGYSVRLGLLQHRKFRMSEDFDAPLDDFKDYM
jgi:hypothetical protein